MKVKLNFDSTLDYELEEKLPKRGYVIRLSAWVQFKTKTGWADPHLAIVDTGAPNSIIPRRIWSKSITKILTDHEVRGIVPLKECSLSVIVGEIPIRLLDEKNYTKEFKVLTYLALTNKIPLILGFKDLLEKFDVRFSYKKKLAWVEEE